MIIRLLSGLVTASVFAVLTVLIAQYFGLYALAGVVFGISLVGSLRK